MLVTGANTVGYALTSYMPTYLTTTLGYDAEHGPLLTLPILVLVAFLVPTMGWVSDHLGRKPVLFSAALSTVVLAVPSFLLMEHGELWSTLLGLTLFAYPTAAYVGNLASSLPALFPTASRYGGMGISYNVAVALFGGTAAFIMEALVTSTGSKLAPAFWLMGTSGAAFIALFKLRETARRPLPGSMPSVASQEEVVELVETQEDNPDLDVERSSPLLRRTWWTPSRPSPRRRPRSRSPWPMRPRRASAWSGPSGQPPRRSRPWPPPRSVRTSPGTSRTSPRGRPPPRSVRSTSPSLTRRTRRTRATGPVRLTGTLKAAAGPATPPAPVRKCLSRRSAARWHR